MAQWNSKVIAAELKSIQDVTKVENVGQGGDVDSDNFILSINGGRDKLYVCAFDPERDTLTNPITPELDDLPFVELNDGHYSGLESTNEVTGIVYVRVRNYFAKKGFQVVGRLKDYF